MIDLKPACRRVIDLLAGVADNQLTNPTPCTEYAVSDLIDHLDEVSRGFAAVARKDTGEQTGNDAGPAAANLGDDRREGVAKHMQTLGEAWDDPAAWQGNTRAADLDMPNELWGRIALTEVVVHGWDIAKATDQSFDLPEETLRACLDHVAEFIPHAPVADLWGPAVEVPTTAPLFDRVVAMTGRHP